MFHAKMWRDGCLNVTTNISYLHSLHKLINYALCERVKISSGKQAVLASFLPGANTEAIQPLNTIELWW